MKNRMQRMIRKKKTAIKLKAEFTLEAAVIVPICFLLLVTSVFLAFYMHDQLAIKAIGNEIAIDRAEAVKKQDNEPIPQENSEVFNRLVSAKELAFEVDAGPDTVKASGSASFPVPLFMVRQFLGEQAESVSAEAVVSHLDARGEILKYKAAADGMETAGIIGNKGEAKTE